MSSATALEGELLAGSGWLKPSSRAAGLAGKPAIARRTAPSRATARRRAAINRVADQRMAGVREVHAIWWVRPVSRRHSIKAA